MADQNPWMPSCEHGIPLTACRDCSTDNLLACRALLAMVWGEARVPTSDRIWRAQVAKALGREDPGVQQMADVLPLDARVEMEQLRQRIEAAKGMIQQMDTVVVRQRQQIHDLTELLSEASGWLQDPSAYHGTDGAADFDKRLGEALTPQGKDTP